MTTQPNAQSKLKESDLHQFTGTGNYFRYSPQLFPNFLLTDGARYLAENGQCFWLFDQIASSQGHSAIKKYSRETAMQFWMLTVETQAGVLICDDGNGTTIYQADIPYTDFPLDRVRIWVSFTQLQGGKIQTVAMLPSEY